MARMARVVVPYYPRHVTQRGNRRQKTFFSTADYQTYIDLLVKAKATAGVEVWAYCLMPNHVHLAVVPEQGASLADFFSEAHRQYTLHINRRKGWRGHLWQERYHSFVMDEQHLLAAVRYIELNPVRAHLCPQPEQWRWSSVHAHLARKDDGLVTVAPMLNRIEDWRRYLAEQDPEETVEQIRKHTRTGRPMGENEFLDKLEQLTGQTLRKGKPGPKTIVPTQPMVRIK